MCRDVLVTKDNLRSIYHNVYYIDYDSDSSSDVSNDMYDIEVIWSSKAWTKFSTSQHQLNRSD
jgi:hypothetical protein